MQNFTDDSLITFNSGCHASVFPALRHHWSPSRPPFLFSLLPIGHPIILPASESTLLLLHIYNFLDLSVSLNYKLVVHSPKDSARHHPVCRRSFFIVQRWTTQYLSPGTSISSSQMSEFHGRQKTSKQANMNDKYMQVNS